MKRLCYLGATCAATLMLTACAADALRPDAPARLSQAEADLLAPAFDDASAGMVDGQVSYSLNLHAAASPDRTDVLEFSRTRSCPHGGEMRMAGTHTREWNRQAGSMTARVQATKTAVGCTFARGDGATIAIDGNPHIAVSGTRHRVMGQPHGPQTLRQHGSFTWRRSTGGSGTCDVDLTSTADPAARTVTVQGSFCGHTVDRTRRWGAAQ
jgi:hypothetical protein